MALDKSVKLTGEGAAFLKEMQELGKLEVAIGFQRGTTDEKGTDLCDIAAWNDLGTEPSGKSKGIPSRPFMRDSVNLHKEEIRSFAAKAAQQITKGGSAEQALKNIGLYQKSLVQGQITDGNYEPNAKSTIREKGSSHPLIDTGRMRQSVSFQVRKRSNS